MSGASTQEFHLTCTGNPIVVTPSYVIIGLARHHHVENTLLGEFIVMLEISSVVIDRISNITTNTVNAS